MKVAVTGGAGYIGSTLVKSLIEDGNEVISIDNLMNGNYSHLITHGIDKKAELHVADIRDREKIEELFEGSEAIAHLAALPGLDKCRERPEEATSINIYGTHQVLETARRLDIEKFVFCSSAAIYGKPEKLPVTESHPARPLNLYGITKLAGEKLVESYHNNYGIETIILRFGNVFGVGLYTNYDTVIPKFVRMGLKGESLTAYGDGTSTRDFVHVEDIVQALKLSLASKGHGGQYYNVGGETMEIGVLAKNISEYLKKITGETISIEHLPPRPGETKELSYDYGKIEKDLGYEPRWSIMEGVEQIAEFTLNKNG